MNKEQAKTEDECKSGACDLIDELFGLYEACKEVGKETDIQSCEELMDKIETGQIEMSQFLEKMGNIVPGQETRIQRIRQKIKEQEI